MYNAIRCIGAVNKEANEVVPSYYVRKLSEPIHNTNRNITCDNWFSSVPLFEKMKNDKKITMVGTIRKNKPQIPASFKKVPSDGSKAQFGYHNGMTLVSYNPNKKNIILLLSLLHPQDKMDEEANKPGIVLFYNKSKVVWIAMKKNVMITLLRVKLVDGQCDFFMECLIKPLPTRTFCTLSMQKMNL